MDVDDFNSFFNSTIGNSSITSQFNYIVKSDINNNYYVEELYSSHFYFTYYKLLIILMVLRIILSF